MSTESKTKVHLPLSELLSLAIRILYPVYQQQISEYNRLNEMGEKYDNEATSVLEDVQDTSLTFAALDPVAYRQDSTLRIGEWPSKLPMPEGADQLETRCQELLGLGNIPKAFYVMPRAVEKFRRERKVGQDSSSQEREDALLDLLIFLSSSRNQNLLFELVGEGGRA